MAIKRSGRVGQMAGDATEVACKARWVYGQQGVRLGHFDGKKGALLAMLSMVEMGWYRRGPLERISENCPIAPAPRHVHKKKSRRTYVHFLGFADIRQSIFFPLQCPSSTCYFAGAMAQFSQFRSNAPLRYHPISTMESMTNTAPFSRQNDPASPPAAHKPTALCPRLPLRPLPSARLARPSFLPFIPPLPAPGRPAESLA
jgi:hypothetical protein